MATRTIVWTKFTRNRIVVALVLGADELGRDVLSRLLHLPYLPIYHYVNIRATKTTVHGFQPNPNMQDNTWNTNEWWVQKA